VLQGERGMVQGNKTLGRFQLTGIAPSPRGVPQIEVSFDIDANGIVHVSAKDLGTGNQQNVTITASSNLNEDEIKRAVADSEKFADEDKKRKDEVETKNHADQLIYTTERSLKDMGDKIDASGKEQIEKSIADLRKTLEGGDVEMIKTATESLTEVSYSVFGKVYEQAQQQAGDAGFDPNAQDGNADADSQGKDNVVDADYEVVDDNK
jgi:molecular chaperone DnaK